MPVVTGMQDDDYVTKMMLHEVSKTKVITRDEEQLLFREYETATPDMKQVIKTKLVQANLRFVLKIALQYKAKMSVDVNEVMTEGKIGLLNAVDLFDWRKGNKFISFAVWQIRCRISKYLEERDLIRLPAHQRVKLNRARKEMESDEFNDEIQYLHRIAQSHSSLDSPVGEEDTVLGDLVKDENAEDAEKISLLRNISNVTSDILETALSEDEYKVITRLFGLCGYEQITLRETKELIGKSHERVRQLRDRALKKLAKHRDMKEFRYALDDIQ
jgi:RNA polymerase primary sigma factor